jgi:hypothetical protein
MTAVTRRAPFSFMAAKERTADDTACRSATVPVAVQALDHEDIVVADADQRACLVLAVLELPLLVGGKLTADLNGDFLGQGTACIEPEHQHGQTSAIPFGLAMT